MALRQLLDLYVCIRPVRWFKGVPSPVKRPEDVDMVIFRENTEDIYAGIEFEAGSDAAKKVLGFLQENFPDDYRRSASRQRPPSASSRFAARAPSASCARRSSTPSSKSAGASRSSTRATS